MSADDRLFLVKGVVGRGAGVRSGVTRASLRWSGRPHAQRQAKADLGLSALSPVDWSRELFCIGCVYPVPSAVSCLSPPHLPNSPSVSFFRPREKEETLCLFCALGTLICTEWPQEPEVVWPRRLYSCHHLPCQELLSYRFSNSQIDF